MICNDRTSYWLFFIGQLFIDWLFIGHHSKWESSGSLTFNDSFDESAVAMSSSPSRSSALSGRRLTGSSDCVQSAQLRHKQSEGSSVPPPLPEKQSVSEYSNLDGRNTVYHLPARQHSHKGRVSHLLHMSTSMQRKKVIYRPSVTIELYF